MRFGDFELDDELRLAGQPVKLPPRQLRLLQFLARHAGRVVTRQEIQDEIWGSDTYVDFQRNLNVCIAQLRAALGDDSEAPRFIATVPRRGYRFVASVAAAPPAPEAAPRPASTAARTTPDRPRDAAPTRHTPTRAASLAAIAACATLAFLLLRPATPAASARIAVIPFTSADTSDAPFLDGLSSELMSTLGSQNARLSVLGRASVVRAKDYARDLHADYIVEGALRHDQERARLTVSLTRVKDQVQVWTDTFERDTHTSFELQEDAAARVTAGVLHTLFPEARATVRPARGVSDAAYQAYLNGRYMQQQSGARRSIPFLQEAIADAPNFAASHAALAESYVSLGRSGGAPGSFELARPEAIAALRLDPANAEAHNALGNILFWQDWNWAAAGREFQAALDANPSFARAHHDQAFYLVATGHREAALNALRRAIALDPLSPRVTIDAGWLLIQAHHFEEAIAATKRALELEPGMREAEACQARALAMLGRGQPADATSTFMHATYLSISGQSAPSIDALEKAYAEHSVMMVMLNSEPGFDKIRAEPRFQALVARMHF